MNKKDMKLIGLLVIIIVVIAGGVFFYQKMNEPTEVVQVTYHDKVIAEYDINKDGIYEVQGDYGLMHVEIKDRKFRVVDVECPNQICVGMGWIDAESVFPIACIPNGVMVAVAMD